MLRKPQTTGFWRGRLPHWEIEDGRYFVTIHLAGAIPTAGAERIRVLSEEFMKRSFSPSAAQDLLLARTIFRELEAWLDRCEQNTLLRQRKITEMVTEAIEYRFRCGRWLVYQYAIMPNHIHLFMSVLIGTLKDSMEDFKRWTGHRAAQLTALPGGRFWQDEWFDHWSRSDEQDDRIIKYIQQNPVNAGLVKHADEWKYSGSFT